jgi:hypothetical protein
MKKNICSLNNNVVTLQPDFIFILSNLNFSAYRIHITS